MVAAWLLVLLALLTTPRAAEAQQAGKVYRIGYLPDRRVEIYREPVPDVAASFGWRYGRLVTVGPDDRISPLAAPAAEVAVADLLP